MSLLFALLLAAASAQTPWWNELGDPGLTEAIDAGLADNGDMAAAWERVAASQALARQARAPLMPSAQATFSSSTAPYDSLGFQFGLGGGLGQSPDPPNAYHTGSYGLSASWDVDLFGRSYTNLRASTLDARAASGDRDAAAMTLASAIASIWYDLVAVEQRMAIVRIQLGGAKQVLEVTEMRFEGGELTGLDVLQQRQQLATVRTLLPVLNMQRRVLQQQLAVLMGRQPDAELPTRPDELPELPALPAELPVEQLVETRPDLVAADDKVRAARSRKKAAVLGAAPAFRVTATTGNQFSDFGEWDSQKYWNVGTSASVPLFAGGRIFEGVRAAHASQLAAEHSRDQLQLAAQAEVASARAREEEQRAYVAAVTDQVNAANLAYEAARERYKSGSTAYINMLGAANGALQAELTLVQAERDLLGIHMDLRDAMGGAWADELGERAER